MRSVLAGSAVAFAASSISASAWAQQADGPEVLLSRLDNPRPIFCTDESCASLVPAGWDLAQTSMAGALADPAEGSSQPPMSDGLAGKETDGHPATTALDKEPRLRRWSDHVPGEHATHRGFWKQTGAIKTETLLFLGYFSLQSGKKLFREHTTFHFHDEGWFGKSTTNLGIDKLTHAFDTYLIAEILHMRLHEASNASEGDALTAAILASGLMAFNELSDGIESDSGYSMQDVAMNVAGAGFSVLRNTVPGLKEKVAFKIEIVPNGNVYSYRGQKHYEQQRYMFSLKGAGFKALRETPFRFLDLQVGYYGSDFFHKDRAAGIEPKRHLFVGLGLNVGEIMFGNARSMVGKAGYTVLDYLQLPYTSLRYDTTGRLGS